jgi:hypothetical protein
MARYRIENTVVNTDNATQSWDQATYWDGHNHVSKATGSQWIDQRLYRSRKGRYYTVTSPRIDGQRDYAEWLSPQEATRWLLQMEHELPEDLEQYSDEVSE